MDLHNCDSLDEDLVLSTDGLPVPPEEEIEDCPVDTADLGTNEEIRIAHIRKIQAAQRDELLGTNTASPEDASKMAASMLGLDPATDSSTPTITVAPGVKIPHPGIAPTGEC